MRNSEADLKWATDHTRLLINPSGEKYRDIIKYWITKALELEKDVNNMKSCINCGEKHADCTIDENNVIECWENSNSRWKPKQCFCGANCNNDLDSDTEDCE
jgi:hypothetical protein